MQDIFHEFGRNMGTVLLPWLKKFEAEIVVAGGNITGAYPLFQKELMEVLEKGSVQVTINLSELKEDAALIGSARIMDDTFYEKVSPTLKYM